MYNLQYNCDLIFYNEGTESVLQLTSLLRLSFIQCVIILYLRLKSLSSKAPFHIFIALRHPIGHPNPGRLHRLVKRCTFIKSLVYAVSLFVYPFVRPSAVVY